MEVITEQPADLRSERRTEAELQFDQIKDLSHSFKGQRRKSYQKETLRRLIGHSSTLKHL